MIVHLITAARLLLHIKWEKKRLNAIVNTSASENVCSRVRTLLITYFDIIHFPWNVPNMLLKIQIFLAYFSSNFKKYHLKNVRFFWMKVLYIIGNL